jgi:predicted outer membrane repeat protein
MERSTGIQMAVAVCVLAVGLCGTRMGEIIFVDDDASGAGNGSSWEAAFAHLQDALAVAQAGDEIRVAQGIYTPDRGANAVLGDRDAMFRLVSGATLAGGYAGLGGVDSNAYDIDLYETILSGDLNGDDGPDFSNYGDNSCYGVVNSLSNDATTILRGFTITGGWANTGAGIRCLGSAVQIDSCTIVGNKTRGTHGHGAGVYNSEGSPTLTNCTVRGNWAWGNGGGLFSENGDLVLEDCLFEGNTAVDVGGGLYCQLGAVVLERCTFRYNEGRNGGGMYISPSEESMCVDSLFIGNIASIESKWGGSGGGGYVTGGGSMEFRECLFEGNSAESGSGLTTYGAITVMDSRFRENVAWEAGGGIFNRGTLDLTRCRFTRNEGGQGGALNSGYSSPMLTDCVFEGNVATGGGGAVYAIGGPVGRGGDRPTNTAPILASCRFTGNRAIRSAGGGLYNDDSDTTLTNCLFVGNAAGDGGGIYSREASPWLSNCTLAHNRGGLGGAVSEATRGTVLNHCIVWGNDDSQLSGAVLALRSDIQGGWPEEGYLDVDPLFADPGYWDPNGTVDDSSDDIWVDGDYHLKSREGRWDPASASWVQDDVNSPCIDAGSADSDVREEPSPNGGVINLGAYGGTIEASKTDLGDPP